MKVIILVFLFLNSSWVSALCLPDSQDHLLHLDSETVLLEHSAKHFEDMVFRALPPGTELTIQFQSLNPRVNAEINKSEHGVVIDVMGGMLGHSRMNENALRLLLCHELGHFLGGPPLKARGGWSSTEGQADYFSGSTCTKLIGMDENALVDGAIRLTTIYSEVMREPSPKLDQCDDTRVQRTNFGYPKVQCRLDTILSGWKAESRPNCWFAE